MANSEYPPRRRFATLTDPRCKSRRGGPLRPARVQGRDVSRHRTQALRRGHKTRTGTSFKSEA